MGILLPQVNTRNLKACLQHNTPPKYEDNRRLRSITPAFPGWRAAYVDKATKEVHFEPVAAWAIVERPLDPAVHGCICTEERVHALVMGDSGALDLIDRHEWVVVPPGWNATWNGLDGWIRSSVDHPDALSQGAA